MYEYGLETYGSNCWMGMVAYQLQSAVYAGLVMQDLKEGGSALSTTKIIFIEACVCVAICS